MSGTSFDGVDAAIIKTDGHHYIKRIETSFIKYSSAEKALYQDSILKNYKKIANVIDNKHKQVIEKIIKKFGKTVDVIGLHGQTFFHNPSSGWTWQYINSKEIMRYFKTNVVSDFRVADINKGGEGAPLVPIFHKNLILQKNFDLPVGVLNIGGVSNITIIRNKNDFLGFDTGPGNGPIDLLVYSRLNMPMDKNGNIANNGNINNKIKEKTLDLFRKNFQTISFDRKKLDNICLTYMASLDIKDALATLIAVISEIIYIKVREYNLKKIIVTGGGRKNQVLVKSLQSKFENKVILSENIDLDGDSLEAEAFGYLAVRSILGKPYTFKNTTGVSKSSSGGVLFHYKD
tara:strand:- start:38 stop:1075 length:1038 start_codon:yes stop_codon:yes gene_type:complete